MPLLPPNQQLAVKPVSVCVFGCVCVCAKLCAMFVCGEMADTVYMYQCFFIDDDENENFR